MGEDTPWKDQSMIGLALMGVMIMTINAFCQE